MGFLVPPHSEPKPDAKGGSAKQPTETFRWLRSHEENIQKYQFDIARWIMASLLVVNGGGLLSLPDVVEKHPAAAGAATWFLVGVIGAVLVGTFAWFNCNCITMATSNRTNWEAVDYQESATADKWDVAAITFAWLSVASVVVSLGAFTAGAIVMEHGVEARSPTSQSATPSPPPRPHL
jgi:hypothetical protein